MTDSIAVLPPGWRALDNNGAIIPLATLYFYETDGVTPLEVFSDIDLSASLGTEVGCNSGGYPVSDADARVIIYTGSTPYNVLLKDGSGVTVWSHENVRGAVNTSQFLTVGGLVAASPVVTVASDTTRTDDDAGKIINGNTTGEDIATTFPDAASVGNGVRMAGRHGGTANQHILKSAGGGFVGVTAGGSAVSVALTQPGEVMWFVSNGTDWQFDGYKPPLHGSVGIIQIADRLSTPPGSPQAGARYIVTSSPTGAWSSFAEHDIAEWDGVSAWFRYTPPTDCGWIAYVQDEDTNYQFQATAWIIAPSAAASQAQMEAATSNAVAVTPANQHFHPGMAKMWAIVRDSAIDASYNVTSITVSSGFIITIENDFSSEDWAYALGSDSTGTSSLRAPSIEDQTAGAVKVTIQDVSGSGNQSGARFSIVGYGDI